MFYEEVFRELNKRKVRYVVVGGVALVLHGVVRLTVDVDLYIRGLKTAAFRPQIGNGRSVFRSKKPRTSGRGASFVDFSEENLLKFAKVMTGLRYRPKIPVKAEEFADRAKRERWKKEKGMVVFSFFHLTRHQDRIDVFVYEPIKFSEVYKERKLKKADDLKIPVVSIRHLKKLKKKAARPQDLADIEALTEIERFRKRK